MNDIRVLRVFLMGIMAVFCPPRTSSASGVSIGAEAYYVVSTSVEGQTPPVSKIRITVTGEQEVDARVLSWWEMIVELRGGGTFGVRILSERMPMTSPDGVGEIARYLYRDAAGKVVEYREGRTERALLPLLDFRKHFLPRVSIDAHYRNGFASCGGLMGHVLTRVPRMDDLDRVSFDDPIVLTLRSDFIIAASAEIRQPEGTDYSKDKARPYSREDYETMIDAGANLFRPTDALMEWLKYLPVYYQSAPLLPDSFYRSNYWLPRMYLDEPSVRLGWSGGIPNNPLGPEQVAEALRQHVAAFFTSERLRVRVKGDLGRMDLIHPNTLSWDTDYWSAWYQLAAGAPAIVHEARYEAHNYGWHPKDLFGEEGLDGIGLAEQVNCMNGFMRGAARAFGGTWGTSGYPEGNPDFRLPAFTRAYDMGARYLWFWTHYPSMSFKVQEEIIRGVMKHASRHPRDFEQANKAAKVGIAFPSGYVFGWNGTWGMEREQHTLGGASYADISAAGLWEGIFCSLRGVEFDFLVDEARIHEMGYEQLVVVKTDGTTNVIPSRTEIRAATDLALTIDDGKVPNVSERMKGDPDYIVKRTVGVTIDGDLSDWRGADWIELRSDKHGWPDKVDLGWFTLTNDLSNKEYNVRFKRLMGMSVVQVDDKLEAKYELDEFNGQGIVVTEVIPGSPADKAGIREGDVIVGIGPWDPIKYLFRVWQFFMAYADGRDGDELRFHIMRSGRYDFRHEGDLDADIAMAVDDEHLYLAVRVVDDVHSQRHFDWEYWKGDSLQIGFDPTRERRDYGYGEENQEFGFILQDDETLVWRYRGRRGQALGCTDKVNAKIVRHEKETVYEAALPLAELAPMAPDLWPMCGFNIVVNDSDGKKCRKARIELRRPAMTRGKRPKDFALLRFEPSPNQEKISAALLWRKRATRQGGGFRLVLAGCSPKTRNAMVSARLQSLDSPDTDPTTATLQVQLLPEPGEVSLHVGTNSPPGRYRLTVEIQDKAGVVAATDSLPVYIYPDVR